MSCLTPYMVKQKMSNEKIPVPCGKCPECVKRRTSAWSFRLMEEDKVAETSHFITLTYDTLKVPITHAGYMTLIKRDLQLFFKRLRKAHEHRGMKPIKYYAVGEYGGKTFRPHYHIILFNADITLIQPAWDNGHVHYGSVSGASVGYTMKYIAKKGRIPMHRNDDRLPEFGLMSKGLGQSYLTPAMMHWHKKDLDNRMYCNLKDGRKISMPRYYKDKIYTEEQRKRIAFFQQREAAQRQYEAMLKEGDDYWRNKAERDKAAFARMKLKSIKDDRI